MLGRLAGFALAAALALPGAAAAQQIEVAPYDSLEDRIGYTLLYFAGGRSREEALRDGNAFNPFGINTESLLYTVRAFFITAEFHGEPLREGELAVFPQFATPHGVATPSAETPAIIPFALMQQGRCFAGYVAGHPAPDTVYRVDLGGALCHAATVEDIVAAAYAGKAAATAPKTAFDPARASDVDLDVIVWAAYNAAYRKASADPDYLFVRDGDYDRLRAAILAKLEREGYAGIAVAPAPAASLVEAFACAPGRPAELRIAFLADNAGVALVASAGTRRSSYRYDPAVSHQLDIQHAGECGGAGGPGRAGVGNVP